MSSASCVKTKIPEQFKPMIKIPFCDYRKYRPEFLEAPILLKISGDLFDAIKAPHFCYWTPEECAQFLLDSIGYSEYREAFLKNHIDGRALVFLTADKFPKMSIKKFGVIKEITAKRREVCKLDQDEFKRSISLPKRRPLILFLWYKARQTGPTAYYMTPTNYYKLLHIIPEEVACGRSYYALLNHWNRIPPFMPWCPHVMIGSNRRVNPMTGTTQRQNFHPRGHPYLLKDDALCIYYIPCDFKFPAEKVSESENLNEKETELKISCF